MADVRCRGVDLFSIAVFNILMGLALAALFFSGERLRLPRIKLPLAIFMGLTLLTWACSRDPWIDGYPQIRNSGFFAFAPRFSTLRSLATLCWLFLTWAGLASISALRGFVQFAGKMQQAHQAGGDTYSYYVSERITGFNSHWNTFSAQEMFAFVMLAALLLFGGLYVPKRWIWIFCGILIAVALYLGETRAVWIATALGTLYLVWFWKKWFVALMPLAVASIFLFSPPVMRERFTSLFHARQVDSNQFRIIAWNAGVEMIEKHPLLGLGPEGPKYHFQEYVPPDTWASRPPGFYQHLHNVYLQYGAERGIPALLVFLWLLGQILVDFWRGLARLAPGAQR